MVGKLLKPFRHVLHFKRTLLFSALFIAVITIFGIGFVSVDVLEFQRAQAQVAMGVCGYYTDPCQSPSSSCRSAYCNPGCRQIGGHCENYGCGGYMTLPAGDVNCSFANGYGSKPYARCCGYGMVCSYLGGSCVPNCAATGGLMEAWGNYYCSTITRGYAAECCVSLNLPPPPSGGGGGSGGGWGNCSTPQGNGVCQNMNTTSCSGLDIAGYCPGPSNIRCCVPIPRYDISGTVFNDTNRNSTQDGGEVGVSGVTITLGGSGNTSKQTDGNGNYSFTGLQGGRNYTVGITVPSGYVRVDSGTYSVDLNANAPGRNFAIVNIYSITGNVFDDVNKDRIKDIISTNNPTMESNITSGITITKSTGNGTLTENDAAGTYSITGLFAGTYTISFTTNPLPAGYFMIFPLNGPPPQHQLTVGPDCPLNVNLSFGMTCTNGNLSNANFALSNSVPWFQTYGLNMRLDEGFEDKIPGSPLYPAYASVADNANGSSNLVTPTPTFTPTPTRTPTPTVTPTRTPTPVPPTATPTSVPGVGAGCNAWDPYTGNHYGTCYDRNVTACGTYYDEGDFCPGGASVQCCVTNQQACRNVGRCHNRYQNNGTYTYNCTQTWYDNVCPGPFDVQCCAP